MFHYILVTICYRSKSYDNIFIDANSTEVSIFSKKFIMIMEKYRGVIDCRKPQSWDV